MSATYELMPVEVGTMEPPLHQDIEVQALAGNILTTYKIESTAFVSFCRAFSAKLSAPPEIEVPGEEKAKLALMKATVKGALLTCGPFILKILYGGKKDHPKPGKKDDLIEWYSNAFAERAAEWALKNTILLKGEQVGDGICRITEVYSRPNTTASSKGDLTSTE